jgi:carbon-monoxide dehydrogenase medium subunit
VLTADAIARAADLAAEAAQPTSDHRGSAAYKRHVVHTFVTRLLTRVSTTESKAA